MCILPGNLDAQKVISLKMIPIWQLVVPAALYSYTSSDAQNGFFMRIQLYSTQCGGNYALPPQVKKQWQILKSFVLELLYRKNH